jgi:hypothetical protein
MLGKWAKEVGEGTETEAERALNILAMMDVMDEEKGRRGETRSHAKVYTHLANIAF